MWKDSGYYMRIVCWIDPIIKAPVAAVLNNPQLPGVQTVNDGTSTNEAAPGSVA